MITGYNNDIKHRGTVFHVQTEDKGEASAWIESLIYTGGRILARKRVTYKQLLAEGAATPAIAKLMERQHRLMIHQIREGRFDAETTDGVEAGATPTAEDDAKTHTVRMQQQAEAMFAPDTEAEGGEPATSGVGAESTIAEEAAAEEGAAEEVAATAAAEAEAEAAEEVEAAADAEAADAEAEDAEAANAEAADAGAEDAVVAVEEEDDQAPAAEAEAPSGEIMTEDMPPAPLLEQPTPAPEEPAAAAAEDDEVELEVGPAPTLDQVIFDYLSSVAQEESLVLLMDESPALASGTTTRMDLGTHASRSGKPIANAVVAVRMISKTGGPVTLAEGATDEEGTLQLIVEVPEVEQDSAALIITAASSIGNAEIKHLL